MRRMHGPREVYTRGARRRSRLRCRTLASQLLLEAEPRRAIVKPVPESHPDSRGSRLLMKKRFPEGWAHWAIAALALFMVLGPLFAEATVSRLRPYDEGIALTSAFRMYAGETRLQDFDTVYGPAESGVLYLLSGSTGPKLLHLRFLRYADSLSRRSSPP